MKIEIKKDLSFYQMKELLKFVFSKLNLEFENKEIPENLKKHFKEKNKLKK